MEPYARARTSQSRGAEILVCSVGISASQFLRYKISRCREKIKKALYGSKRRGLFGCLRSKWLTFSALLCKGTSHFFHASDLVLSTPVAQGVVRKHCYACVWQGRLDQVQGFGSA